MKKSIIDYHQDEDQHWVAELFCVHYQHVRYNPPWANRFWVTTLKGRTEKLGLLLNCKKCDVGAPLDKHISIDVIK